MKDRLLLLLTALVGSVGAYLAHRHLGRWGDALALAALAFIFYKSVKRLPR